LVWPVNAKAIQQIWINQVRFVWAARVLPWIDRLDAHFTHMTVYGFVVYFQQFMSIEPCRYISVPKLWVRYVYAVYLGLDG
jgi:hypothetical protein